MYTRNIQTQKTEKEINELHLKKQKPKTVPTDYQRNIYLEYCARQIEKINSLLHKLPLEPNGYQLQRIERLQQKYYFTTHG